MNDLIQAIFGSTQEPGKVSTMMEGDAARAMGKKNNVNLPIEECQIEKLNDLDISHGFLHVYFIRSEPFVKNDSPVPHIHIHLLQ